MGGDLVRWLAECRDRQLADRDQETLLTYSDQVDAPDES